MTAWTTPATWAAATLTAAQLNEQLRDDLSNLDERLVLHGMRSATRLAQVAAAPVGVRCVATGTQSIPDATDTTVTWDSEAYDTDGFHSTSSDTGRITIPAGLGGLYVVSLDVAWSAPAGGLVCNGAWVEDDAGTVLLRRRVQWQGRTTLCGAVLLAAGDWVVGRVVQDNTSSSAATLHKESPGCGLSAWRLFAS